MTAAPPAPPLRAVAILRDQRRVSVSGLLRIDLELPRPPGYAPGQFAMLNLVGPAALTFARPFSILAADGPVVSVLYRVVGGGTAGLAGARPGDRLSWLGPLGRPFPARGAAEACLLLAGGVGLPPLLAWHASDGRPGDLACFGARHPDDVPWPLLGSDWEVAVEAPGPLPPGRAAAAGTVVARAGALLPPAGPGAGRARRVLACGPLPMLRAAVALAESRGWPCLVSVEEHMGCGFGVCRGCVVPRRGGGWLAACQDGPVLDAAAVDWDLFGRPGAETAGVAAGGCRCGDGGGARP